MSTRITAIIKPTHRCNMSCKYCYVEESADQNVMTAEVLERMTRQLFSLDIDCINFLWHGGEPLLMGLPFYEYAVKLQKQYQNKVLVQNSMQTNATLIDDEFLDFAEREKFNIGVSLDGPIHINNLSRQFANGTGAFDKIYRGLKLIRSRNNKRIGGGALIVLHKLNIKYIDEIYRFFRDNSISFKINPLITSGMGKTNASSLAIKAKEYGLALIRFFDLWFFDDGTDIDISPLTDFIGSVTSGRTRTCTFSESCRKNFVSIGPSGDVHPCGRFDGVAEYKIGNLMTTDLKDIINEATKLPLYKNRSDGILSCQKCEFKGVCNAGCMHNAYMVNGNSLNKDYYCPGYKMIFSHIRDIVNRELSSVSISNKENHNEHRSEWNGN